MPLDGSDVASAPAGSTAVPNTPIESAKYNALWADIYSILNTVRTPAKGYTGETAARLVDTWYFYDPGDNTKRIRFDAGSVTAGNTRVLTAPDKDLDLAKVIEAGAAMTLTASEQAQARSNLSAVLKGHIYGLTLSNNASDATNDIDIAAGEAASTETNPVLMVLASAITKRLDASWAVGSGNGGLDTGSIANGTYHVWLIRRSDTGVVDALFSASASAPTMPTNYDQKRLIGSIIRSSGAIKSFVQDGDTFMWKSPVADISVTNPGTSAVSRTLTIPIGRRLEAIMAVGGGANIDGQGPGFIYISDLSLDDVSPGTTGFSTISLLGASYQQYGGAPVRCRTNTSAQVRSKVQLSGSSTQMFITTLGWNDTRGRLG